VGERDPAGAAARGEELRRGIPLVEERDPQALDREIALLRNIAERRHWWDRWRGYWGLSGPGWVQSALTLGAGSAGSAIFAGSVFGYELLWVQPVAMFLGVVMFAAIGHQVLVTRARPYDVFWKRLHPALALFWGWNVLLASIVWQLPQYSLGTAVTLDILDVAGLDVPKGVAALALLVCGTTVCWSYGHGSRKAIRMFERTLKYMLLLMVVCFMLVVIQTGINWSEMFKGYLLFHVPRSREGITVVLGQLGAAVGVNMTFLYPYTLLARGWRGEHRGLKNFDLGTSMFLPFVLATSFVTMACANTLYARGIAVGGPVDVAHALEPLVGLTFARLIFSLGVLSMCFTTLIVEMLICGFVLSEMFHFELHGRAYRASTMLANIGIIGAFYQMPFWLPVIVSSFNLLMMPVAYGCFFVLQNSQGYLGPAANRGLKGAVWNGILIVAILVVAAGAAAKIISLFW
jgi:manganese transport protein